MEATSMNPSSPSTGTTPSANGADGASVDSMIQRAAQTAHEAIDRMAAKAGPAVDKVRTMASSTTETLQAKADALGEWEDQMIESSREYVRANPLTAVAIGVLAGVVISRLLK